MSDKYLNDEGLEHLVEKIKSLVIANKVIQDNAASHNAFYVEEDITEMYNDGTFTQNVENGTFKDIFPGMYIHKAYDDPISEMYTGNDFVVGDLDYFLNSGNVKLTNHHALMMMKYASNTFNKMNQSDVTTGGYVGSYMWKTTIPLYATTMENTFGSSHIIGHRELLTTGINSTAAAKSYAGFSGASSSASWYNVKFNLMNNNMIYGSQITSSSFYDAGNRTQQLSAIRHNHSLKIANTDYWLSDVASNNYFSVAEATGINAAHFASNGYGIRGYFLLK